MTTILRYAATCPKGVEPILAEELRALGARDVRETRAAVTFAGPLALGYRACLWSRLASRVLLVLAEFPAATSDDLYAGALALPWEDHLSPEGSLAVDAVGTTSSLTHTGFTARRVKDAVVDRLRERSGGTRPSVDLESPDLRLNLRLHKEHASLAIDLSGEPLHRRGYRTAGEQVEAPLKENLAAAILVRAGWPETFAAGGALADPMCGSATLLIEGALIASDQAPGLLRARWGFDRWLGHDADAWATLLDEADSRAEDGRTRIPPILGRDADVRAVDLARDNARRAGLGEYVRVDAGELSRFEPPRGADDGGLVATNPPYGVRLGQVEELAELYARLGERLVAGFQGWRAAVFTAEPSLARATGLRSTKQYTLYNGAVETKLYLFEVTPAAVRQEVVRADDAAVTASAQASAAEQFANRLRKNARHLGKWARRENVTCYRLYDADLPEYAVAVDLYTGAGPDEGRRRMHVQEYAPPPNVDTVKAAGRLQAAVEAIPGVLGVHSEDVVLKVRQRQRGEAQYERQARFEDFMEVAEGDLRFLVNLTDFLDTGLFLDHRPVRARLRELAEGRRFLNLFAYTGAASVHAAAGGATHTTTVDMSSTYLNWARRNMALNSFAEGATHAFVRADVLSWLADERARVESGSHEPFGLVFLDPPTFSTSKTMGERTLDIQRDHVALLRDTVSLLAEDGILVFSNNFRKFEMDHEALPDLDITDITAETIPPDFARNPRIHRAYIVTRG